MNWQRAPLGHATGNAAPWAHQTVTPLALQLIEPPWPVAPESHSSLVNAPVAQFTR